MIDREDLIRSIREYHEQQAAPPFVPGVTEIQSSGACLDADDKTALAEAALDMRIAGGALAHRFETSFARKLGMRKARLTNSGSSANLLAITALTAPELGEARLRPGDEVITCAAGFPTTVNPILQNGLVPVFVDIDEHTYNATPESIAAAIGPRTRAVALAHTLGNPFPVAEVAELCGAHEMFLVEDNCDAVGSSYRDRPTGTFGDLSTVSFYPAHHVTTGEGGCVLTDSLALARIVKSLRDWGRDCWCEPGESNRCGRRFGYQLGGLPYGYDHKYIYSHIGYNLKATDLQAALGLSQLAKLDDFVIARRRNWTRLREGLDGAAHLRLPEPTPGADPSWFGFALTVAPDAPFDRYAMVTFLESRRIATRSLFAGNLLRHPAYAAVPHRISGDLTVSDHVADHTFWIGVYPGITDEMTDYMISSIREFVATHTRSPSPTSSAEDSR
ncbi:lipopolysaccharide biosynthesis protein RfbH [Nocardia sp. alder85J]|uniref:lipopolysaccharide biosynthesis protein RfbH n=1 Tax=Nocardia sp. alder85J TaxID=2862949 RepID=UPI001CD3DAC0|nr:lipopolysaccharide biosynthesis protein RfbH [Nocardia sp. alder85J]MCX4096840.1 lipopolysaccharide biosynthesis protein RfbH [Nocardia sp. alder85J]